MATCKYCKKSGWFLRLDNVGICNSCAQILAPITNRAVQIIEESDKIIGKSKKLETKLSRLDLIEKVVKEHFLPYERMGIQVANQSGSQVLDKVAIMREEIIENTLQEYLNKAKDKAEEAKSEESKINAYSKVLQKITELKNKVPNLDIFSNFESKVKQLLEEIQPNAVIDDCRIVNSFKAMVGKPSTDKYFEFMNQMLETSDYEEKYKYARMSLVSLPFFVKSEIKEYGSFDIGSIPAIDYVKAYLKTHRNKQALEKVYKELSKTNDIESWLDDLSDIMNEIDFLDRLHEFLSDNPGFIQSDLGKTLGIPQRLISNHLSWAEKFGLIQREKKGLKNKIFLLPDHINLVEAYKSDLKESVTTEPVKIIKNETQKELKKIQPRHISLDKVPFSLDKVPYYPLPPSPPIWEAKGGDVIIVFPKKEIFEIAEGAKWEFTENRKLENDEKPETFFKEVRLTASGTLFIDKNGKNEKYQGCKASLLKRDKNGKVTAEAGLSNDIYRIGTSPLNDWYAFMSSEGILHGYNEALEKVFEHDLSEDPRIKEHYESSMPTWGNLRTHIRTVDITTGGSKYLFTIADTAWCINDQLESVWGISVPLNEGWERVVSKIESFYPREEVLYALDVLGLEFPVTQERIKMAYRDMALKWHPDINLSANSKERMQDINRAFSVLTGIDPNSLEIKEKTVFDYVKKPDFEYTIGEDRVSLSMNFGIPQDWIYASGFAMNQKHVYLGTYAGKIIKINENGEPKSVHDVSNTPRSIIDTGDYLYILTDTRLYILKDGEELVDVIDVMMKEKLIVGDESFGFLGKKFIRWFDESGKEIGMLKTKNPIRAVYPGLNCVNVETRQHKAVLSF